MDHLDNVRQGVRAVLPDGLLHDWTGHSAVNFRDKYVVPMSPLSAVRVRGGHGRRRPGRPGWFHPADGQHDHGAAIVTDRTYHQEDFDDGDPNKTDDTSALV
ncbi:hypothetical protein GCM10023214_15330 [Amycolatopsis dongchuanensis]|uniref:Uncharacterized protein n=1 Tax=Amycolatopsis dongchuanensis TaxID=1070866 RepID=A0ABP9QAF5_9PSEU